MAKNGKRARATGDLGFDLAQYAVGQLGWVFERFDRRDRGIDAAVAIADDDGQLTGRYLAAQVKGGRSWFRHETDVGFALYEDLEHFDYWMTCSLPVIILLCDTEKEIVHWVAVTPSSVEMTSRGGRKIVVPRDQILKVSAKPKLLEFANSVPDEAGRILSQEVQRFREQYAAGERRAALESLKTHASGALWRFVHRSVRAEAYVDLAVWSIETSSDVAAAKQYANLAEEEGAKDAPIAHAVIAQHERGAAAAIVALGKPCTGRAYDLLVCLRLAVDSLDAAKQVIESRPSDLSPRPTAARFQSIVQFASGDREQALRTITDAVQHAPTNWWLRHTLASFQLAETLASPTLELLTTGAPMPIIPAVVNHDRDSIAAILQGVTTFAELEQATDDSHLVATARAWRLACLACLPDADRETDELLVEMLSCVDTVTAAVPWALARQLAFDNGEVVRRLQQAIASDSNSVMPIVTAFNVLLDSGQEAAAAKLLKSHRKRLRSAATDLPTELDLRLSLAHDKFDHATKTVSGITDENLRVRFERIVADSRESDWRTSATLHEAEYARGGGYGHLIAAANQRRRGDDWQWILDHAEALLAGAMNEYTVSLAAEAARRMGQPARRAEILDRWLRVTDNVSVPLRRAWITTLLQVDAPRAAREADGLLHDEPSAQNAHLAMQAFLRVLDLKRITIAARTLARAADVDVSTLLSAATMASIDEPATSRTLLKRAIDLEIPDADLPLALILVHNLGLAEMSALFDRLPTLASDRGPIRPVTPNEIARITQQRDEEVNDAMRGYFGAVTPIHRVAHAIGTTMAQWIHEASDEGQSIPLLTRFGAVTDRPTSFENVRLHMDVTALLFAAKLELLDLIENTYAPIFVSVHIGPALFEQHRALARPVPNETAAMRIRSLLGNGRLAVIAPTEPSSGQEIDEFAAKAPPDAIFVTLAQPPPNVPAVLTGRICSLHTFAADLRRRGILTGDDIAKLQDVTFEGDSSTPPPTTNVSVVLSWDAASVLADLDLLSRIAARRPLLISMATAEQCRAVAAIADRRRAAKEFVLSVAERVRDGYGRGLYQNLSSTQPIELHQLASIDGAALHDLINTKLTAHDLVWIDDRAASRLRLAAPVVGVGEVLADLRRRGVLAEASHVAKLSMLRRMGVRYLPLLPEEITLPVLGTPAVEVLDTAEMLALSRYLAATAIDPYLIRSSESSMNEMAYVLAASRQVAAALATLWQHLKQQNVDPSGIAAAIVERMYVSGVGLTTLFDPESPRERLLHAAALELTQFYQLSTTLALHERLDATHPTSATQTFIRWVTRTFAIRRFRSDPEVAKGIAFHLRHVLDHVRAELPSEAFRLFRAVVSLVFTLLPQEVQSSAFQDDPDYWRAYGIEEAMVARVGEVAVSEAEFWSAIEAALTDAPNEISEVEIAIGGRQVTIDDPLILAVGRPGWQRQSAATLSDTYVFDVPRETRTAVSAELNGAKDARDRFVIAQHYRARSIAETYRQLMNRMRHAGSLDETSFVVPALALADHLRLPREHRKQVSVEAWQAAAVELHEDLDVTEALRRLISLPRVIPDLVIERLTAENALESAIRRLAKEATAPVPRMQLASICLRVARSHPTLLSTAKDLVKSTIDAEYANGSFSTFEAILFAVSSWLSYDSEASEYAPDVRYLLAWSHAARLHEIFSTEAQDKVRDYFVRITVPSRDSIYRGSSLHNALAPHYVDHMRTVVFGLAALLRDIPSAVLAESGVAEVIRSAVPRLGTPESLVLLFDPELFVGGRDSIFGTSSNTALAHLVSEASLVPASRDLHDAAAALIATGDREVAGPWIGALGCILRQLPIYSDLRVPFRQAATKLEEAMRATDGGRAPLALAVLADQYTAWGDGDDIRRVEELLMLELKRERDDISEVEFLSYLNTLFSLVSVRTTSTEAARELVRLVERVVEIAPHLGYRAATALAPIAWWLPVDQGGPLWRIVLRARERLGLDS